MVLFAGLIACNTQVKTDEESGLQGNHLAGNWQFLDKYGNYNEAFFTDSTYRTINAYVNKEQALSYLLRNDSLFANLDKRKKGMQPLAGIQWIDDDQVVITTEFVRDTLTRMVGVEITLETTSPFRDSLKFYTAFYQRYEAFLVNKGILSPKEVKAFRERQEVPEDVLNKRSRR